MKARILAFMVMAIFWVPLVVAAGKFAYAPYYEWLGIVDTAVVPLAAFTTAAFGIVNGVLLSVAIMVVTEGG